MAERDAHRAPVVEVHEATVEAALVDQFEIESDVIGQGRRAASYHDRREKEPILVDEARPDRFGGEVWSSDRQVARRLLLHPSDRNRVQDAFDARAPARRLLKGFREDDFVGRAPYLGVVADDRRLLVEIHRLPGHHGLVQLSTVEIRPNRPLEIVDECVHLFVGRRPVEVPALIVDVAVERRDRRVDQRGHEG